jgi:hypothetical protein
MAKVKDCLYYERRMGKVLKEMTIFIVNNVEDPRAASIFINKIAGSRGKNLKEQCETITARAAEIKQDIIKNKEKYKIGGGRVLIKET